MVLIEEDSFPRGGKRVRSGEKRKNENVSLFPNEKPKKIKKDKVSKNSVEDNVILSLNKRGILTSSTIRDGMVVLSCIRKISEHALEVELPGLLNAKVTIDAISDPLNVSLKNALKSSEISSISDILKNIFEPGQYVPLKIRNILNNDEKTTILGSISPTEVNYGRTHNSFKKGEMLWAAVLSELDHGYQLDCGVANCRIFLPNKNLDNEKELKIGQPLWCKVHKVDNEHAASTLRVGAKMQHLDSSINDDNIPLNFILPGTKVDIFVEKVLKHGIYCKFLNNYVGFIHESQLNPPMLKLGTIKESKILSAYVLYVEETTKTTHLSMRSLETKYDQTYARGDKVSAMVIGKNSSGLYFRLNPNDRGWISNKRLLNALGKNSSNFNLIKEKYPNGSKHQCVILSYNHMDRVYICSMEKELVKEKYFDFKDFVVGELVEGVVHEIKPNGIILLVGQVKGFIPNIHLTDSPYSDNLKKKFVLGKRVKARVFLSSEKTVIFTLKSNFVKDDKCLSSLENPTLNKIYPALVLAAKPFGLVLTFYNNIDGFVPLKEFNFQVTQEYKDKPSTYFYSGEVINVRILKAKPDKIIASLVLDGERFKITEIGANVKAIVTKVQENGLTVFVPKKSIEGFVPVEHLSIDKSLCHPMLETFKENDRISDLLIIKSDESGTILSRREAIAYERCDLKVPKFHNIKKGAILRCSVESVEENGVFVSSPMKNFNKKIFVKRKWIGDGENMPEFEIQQSVLGKVIQIDQSKEIIVLSLRSKDVFDKNIQNSVSLFGEYLADEEYLRTFGTENGWPLNEYSIAEKVLCTVKQTLHKGCLVELPNGCQGLVVPSLSGSAKKGDKVVGMVLGHNYALKYVELCLDHKIMKHINTNQDGCLPENEVRFTVHKLLTRDQYILTTARRNGNRQLIYLPLRLCENDFSDSLRSFYEHDTFMVEICGTYGEKLIAFHKKLKHSLDHKFLLKNKHRSHLDTSSSSTDDASISSTVDMSRKCVAVDTINDLETTEIEASENSEAEVSDEEAVMDVPEEDSDNEEDSCEENVEVDDESISDTNEDSGIYSKDSSKGKLSNDGDANSRNEESESDQDDETGEEKEYCEEVSENGREEGRVQFGDEEVRPFKEQDQISCPLPILPSISNFFKAQIPNKLDDSSSDEETEDVKTKKKKKKLTPAEKAEEAKLEEERLSALEKHNADPTMEPKSAEEYERVLLAEPNSSALWIKYISHYLALAEFEKARAIGRKALDTINMTLEDEKFNIWMSLLQVENLYGTKESFDKVFEDAVKFNDAFKVHMKALEMLHESGKLIELDEKIKKTRSKFKQEPEMWVHIAKIYYLLGNYEDARNTKNACLRSITNAKQQFSLIIKFAILEFTYGEIDVGSSIFENVLETHPNKAVAWSVYIDQLISKHQISEARNVLERGITMNLPLKITRVLCHKYRWFEEKYGTPETLEQFKQKAKKILQEKAL